LYEAGGSYTFMENDTGEMYELDKEQIDDVAEYLKENLDCYLMLFE
jgi:translation elongation factor P/translation initiation factor 5A